MKFTIPQDQGSDDHALFQSVIERMAKAGWLLRAVESNAQLSLEFSAKGSDRMKRLAKLAKPFSDRINDASKPKPSVFSQVWIFLRARSVLRELQPPPLTAPEIMRLMAFLAVNQSH